jgi:hypothetical protein
VGPGLTFGRRRVNEQAPNDDVARLNDRARRRWSGELIESSLTWLLLLAARSFLLVQAAGRKNEHADYLLRSKEVDHVSFDR